MSMGIPETDAELLDRLEAIASRMAGLAPRDCLAFLDTHTRNKIKSAIATLDLALEEMDAIVTAEAHCPRILDPDTMRPCTVLSLFENPWGQKLLMVQEDPDADGSRRRWGQKAPYIVAVKSLWHQA